MGNTVKSHTELDCFTQRVVSVFDVWLDELERACAARVSAEKRTRFLNSREKNSFSKFEMFVVS